MKALGKRIRAARERQKLTQFQLGKQMNVARTTVSNWEIGRSQPDYNTLCRLSEVLHCDFMPQRASNGDDSHAKERKLRVIITENPVITVKSPGNAVDFTVGTVDFRLNGSDSHGNTIDFCISAGISVISDDN